MVTGDISIKKNRLQKYIFSQPDLYLQLECPTTPSQFDYHPHLHHPPLFLKAHKATVL